MDIFLVSNQNYKSLLIEKFDLERVKKNFLQKRYKVTF